MPRRKTRRRSKRHLGWPSASPDSDILDGVSPRLDTGADEDENYTISAKDWL